MQRVGEMVGNLSRGSLVATVQKAVQDPRRLRKLENKMDHLTGENQKATERLRTLEAERVNLLKQVKESVLTVQKVSEVVDISGDVWLKAKMFNAELKNAGHVFGIKMITFVMDHGSKVDASLKVMKALMASFTKWSPVLLESTEDGETSSSYSNLTP